MHVGQNPVIVNDIFFTKDEASPSVPMVYFVTKIFDVFEISSIFVL